MSKRLKIAFIGAGLRAQQVTYPSFAQIDDVELVAVCDIDMSKTNEVADKFNINGRYGQNGVHDYQRMLNENEVNAVVAVGQPHELYDAWSWCLSNGYDLFVEKPLGLSIHQARSLEYLAIKNKRITQVSFQRRATPLVMQMKDECLKRGKIVHSVCKFYKYYMYPLLGMRDHMMDDTVHSIDTIRWICGGEVIKIESHTKRVQVPNINFISATLHFNNGSSGYIINSWSSGKRIFSVEMHAPGIFVDVEHEKQAYIYTNGNIEPEIITAQQAACSNELHIYTGVYNRCREFADCCLTRNQPSSCFTDVLKTMEIADIILAQSLLEEISEKVINTERGK